MIWCGVDDNVSFSTIKSRLRGEVIIYNPLIDIDDIGIFPRIEGSLTQLILMDGHGSRLELPFLSYGSSALKCHPKYNNYIFS